LRPEIRRKKPPFARSLSPPYKIMMLLEVPLTESQILQTDSRLALGSDWSVSAVNFTAGGALFTQSSGTTYWTYTPAASWDTAVLFYAAATTNGTFVVNAGGATLQTVNSEAASAIEKVVVTKTLGAAPCNIQWSSGGPISILGGYFYNSAVPAVDVINLGWGGSTAGSWASGGYYPRLNGALAIAPNIAFINLGINDWNLGEGVPAYSTDMQMIITALKPTMDLVLSAPFPSAAGTVPVATQTAYIAALYQLAQQNKLPLIDFTYRFGSWAEANSLGMAYDIFHPLGNGQALMGQLAYKIMQMF
jgi:lysophospholipase L1-like esterase